MEKRNNKVIFIIVVFLLFSVFYGCGKNDVVVGYQYDVYGVKVQTKHNIDKYIYDNTFDVAQMAADVWGVKNANKSLGIVTYTPTKNRKKVLKYGYFLYDTESPCFALSDGDIFGNAVINIKSSTKKSDYLYVDKSCRLPKEMAIIMLYVLEQEEEKPRSNIAGSDLKKLTKKNFVFSEWTENSYQPHKGSEH